VEVVGGQGLMGGAPETEREMRSRCLDSMHTLLALTEQLVPLVPLVPLKPWRVYLRRIEYNRFFRRRSPHSSAPRTFGLRLGLGPCSAYLTRAREEACGACSSGLSGGVASSGGRAARARGARREPPIEAAVECAGKRVAAGAALIEVDFLAAVECVGAREVEVSGVEIESSAWRKESDRYGLDGRVAPAVCVDGSGRVYRF
jgi:hypothetical protein